MRKITFLLTLLFTIVSTAMAQTLVTDAASELTNGVKISLQCRDNNGGAGYYFNGNAAKSATLGAVNIFEVVGNATDGFKLKRITDNKFITRNGDNLGVSDAEGDGVAFTAQSFGVSNFQLDENAMETHMAGTEKDLLVRFTNQNSFLNTQAVAGTPKFAGGKGGYSVWYVYKYSEEEVSNRHDDLTVNHVCNGVTFATTQTGFVLGGSYTATPIANRPGIIAPADLTFTINAATTELTVNYTYNATALPFTVENKYNLFILRNPKKRVTYNSETGKCVNAGTDSSVDDLARFYFEGDNVTGFTIKNVAAGSDKVLGGPVGNNFHMTFSATNTDKFVLENNQGHLVFRNVSHESGYMNDVNGSIGYWVSGLGATDIGSSFEFVDCPNEAILVTYKYCVNGDDSKQYTTATRLITDGNVNTPAPVLKWVKNVSQTVEEGGTDKLQTVKVNCVNGDDLPFTPSESFETATWYLMEIHGNQSVHLVYADAENNVRTVNYGENPTYPAVTTGQGHENEQWCFVGNIYDGFKIYNRVVGSEKCLYQSSDADVEITLDAQGQGFRVWETRGALAESSIAFKVFGRNNYINHREPKVQGWTDNDEGSSFRFYKVTKTLTVADDVTYLLGVVNNRFPEQESEDVTWPSEYVNGGFADFDFLKDAQQAVVDNNETLLAGFKTKLNDFIGLSNSYGYPISYLLTFPKNEYGTAYLPFNTETPAGLTLYICNEVDGDALTLTDPDGNTNTKDNFKANYAYIVQATEEVRGKTRQFIGYGNQRSETQANATCLLKGTHDGCEAPTGSYVLQKHGNVLGFYLVDGTVRVNVPAGKCYLEWPDAGAGVNRLLFPDGTTTGIDTIFDGAQTENAPIYDLSGRRVKNATKGIYIIGGKKVIVK